MPAPDVSVVIVSFNTRELLAHCLESLAAAAPSVAWEAMVVDNGSADGSAAMVRERFPATVLIERPDNPGFARATNLGLARATGRHRVWLNPDCEMRPGSLTALVRYLEAHPEVGAVGPRLLDSDGGLQPSAQAFPNASLVLYRFLGLGRLMRRGALAWLWRRIGTGAGPTARGYAEALRPGAEPRAVDWISGACLATRAREIERIGPLDEGFFMYCEDADWCQRVHAAGLEVHYLPEAVVVHHVGASGPSNPQLAYHFYRSMLRYFRRYRPSQFLGLRAVMLVAFAVRGVGRELGRLVGRPGAHPWWRLAAICWSPGPLAEGGA